MTLRRWIIIGAATFLFSLFIVLVSAIGGYGGHNLAGLSPNEARVAQALFNQGFGNVQVAAIMGNMKQESGDFDPNAYYFADGGSYGLLQWTADSGRYQKLCAFAAERGTEWNDVETQVAFMTTEIEENFGVYGNGKNYGYYSWNGQQWGLRPEQAITYEQWCNSSDLDNCTETFELTFTRAGKPNMPARINYAHKYYQIFISGGVVSNSEIVQRAQAQLGKPYVWGAAGPNSFDCSGLVSYAITGKYEHTWSTQDIITWPKVDDPQPGDICIRPGHTGIYIGNGQMIHAPHTGSYVQIVPVPDNMFYVRYSG